ncbi:hypothetical protein [Maridesulfovibrio sp.]|uniref:hypothetical protein n=1 Tax=Maridesulfovibrio sp. TaxID=2795000 RepID=UPI002A18A587|nr:hypothetical protein [Maridesulfovibrio sp.]
MRDLYGELKLTVSASESEIKKRLPYVLSKSVRRDIEYILLNPNRRLVYDRNWKLMNIIGELRGSLRLTKSDYWGEEENIAYLSLPDQYPPLLDQLKILPSS